jgi:hypothetical protein
LIFGPRVSRVFGDFGPRVSRVFADFGPRVPAIMVGNVTMEYMIDGSSKLNSWKSILLITLELSDLMKFAEEFVIEPIVASDKT